MRTIKLLLFIFLSLIVGLNNGYTQEDKTEYADYSIADSSKEKFLVYSISYLGNNRTKSQIILRELLFAENDSLPLQMVPFLKLQSEKNLMNTSLFNLAEIEIRLDEKLKQIHITVLVKERWYFWPRPFLQIQDRNFNAWWETKDFYRLNYGLFTSVYNIGGRAETFKVMMRKGYTDLVGLSYLFPYLDKKQSLGMSLSARYQENKEIAFSTLNNKLQFHRDAYRASRREMEITAGIIVRRGKYDRHFLDVSYRNLSISDTVLKLNSEYFQHSAKGLAFFCLRYGYRLDLRDSKVFPLEGKLLEFSVEKDGFGLLKQEDIDEFVIAASLKKYARLSERFFISGAVKVRHRMNAVNYYSMNTALGFQDYVKGYEYFVIDGQSFGLSKCNLAYQLVKPSVKKLPIKTFKKFSEIPYSFYVSAHLDAAYVSDRYSFEKNILANELLLGSGLSFTFVTYYDYVLRLDYSINRFAQKGFYLHFNAPI